MPLPTRRLSRTFVAVTAAAAPVVAMAPTAQATPQTPQLPRAPLPPMEPQLPANPVGATPITTPRILPTPSPASQVTMWVNASAGVNVRTGPATSYPVVGAHPYGARLTGTLSNNGWLKTADNRFVAAANLTTSDPRDGGRINQTVTRWVSVPVANIRSGPSTNHSIVGTATQGQRVEGTLESNGWLRVSSSRFLAPTVLTEVFQR